MNAKKLLVGVLLVGAIGVGAVGAQGHPGNPNQPGNPGRPGGFGGRGDRGHIIGDLRSVVIEATGLEPAELREQLREGGTLADAITANGGDVAAVTAQVMEKLTAQVNEAVTNGRITQERADDVLANLETRVTETLNGETPVRGLRDRSPAPEPRGLRGVGDQNVLVDAVIEATGLTRGAVIGQMIDGATLAEIVTDNGGDVDAVIAAALASAAERVNEAVTNGRITQEQADTILAQLSEFYTNAMNGTILQRGERVRGQV